MLEQRDYNAEFEVWFQKLLQHIEKELGATFKKETYDTPDCRYWMRDYFIHSYTVEAAWDEDKVYDLDGQ